MGRIVLEGVTLQQLRALAAVAEAGSFTRAADALKMTQPAISHLIKRMEEELGQQLLSRGRKLVLTAAGRLMVDTAIRTVRLVDESVDACLSSSQLREGRVVLAVAHLTAAALLPPVLRRFQSEHPQLVVTLLDSTADQMKQRLTSQEADLGFGADIGQKRSDFSVERLFLEPMGMFVRCDHVLASRDSVDARHLGDLPFIHVNPEANVWRTVSRQLLQTANVYPHVVHHVSLLSTAFGLIQAGVGVALLPRYVQALMPGDLRCIPVAHPVVEWPVVAVRLAKTPLSPAAMAFLAMARQHMRSEHGRRG